MTCANGRTPPTRSPTCRHGWANRSTPQADATMAARNPWTALEGSENRSGHVGGTPIRGTRVRMPSHRMGYRYEGKGLRRPHGRRIYEPVREGRDRHQGRCFRTFRRVRGQSPRLHARPDEGQGMDPISSDREIGAFLNTFDKLAAMPEPSPAAQEKDDFSAGVCDPAGSMTPCAFLFGRQPAQIHARANRRPMGVAQRGDTLDAYLQTTRTGHGGCRYR